MNMTRGIQLAQSRVDGFADDGQRFKNLTDDKYNQVQLMTMSAVISISGSKLASSDHVGGISARSSA
jgi:hypothetical protein